MSALSALVVCALGAAPLFAGEPVLERADEPVLIPRRASAELQLDLARGWKRAALEEPPGPRRGAALERAVEAYREVRRAFPEERALGAEAAFRAGEILRAAERDDGALTEFAVARDLAPASDFGARALLETGHVHRRAGRARAALEAYERLYGDAEADAERRDEAGLWSARVLFATGGADEARRRSARLAEAARDPVDRVRAWDLLALDWLARGDPEACAGALERCRTALAPLALEETERGRRVRSALFHMRARERLRDALERRRDASANARDAPPNVRGSRRAPLTRTFFLFIESTSEVVRPISLTGSSVRSEIGSHLGQWDSHDINPRRLNRKRGSRLGSFSA